MTIIIFFFDQFTIIAIHWLFCEIRLNKKIGIYTKMRRRYTLGAVCIVIFLGLGLFALIGLPSLVDQMVLKNIVLDPSKVQTWGQNPGHSNTITTRNYTFYNLTNPRQYLYRNATPRFHQITNYRLQELTNFTDLTYSEDQSTVTFNDWVHFSEIEGSRSLDQHVHVLNIGSLGYWSQSESADIIWVAIQGFGGIFYELNNSMKVQAIGKGIVQQFLKDFPTLSSSLCKPMELSDEACIMLYTDPLYGLQNQNNYKLWVNWVLDNNLNDGSKIIDYFGFNRLQIQTFHKVFLTWCQSMSSILQNWYCQGQPCKSYEMMIKQFATASITKNPPSGDPMDSICLTGNVTCEGWPQLYNFYHKVFLPKHQDQKFQGITFQIQLVRKLFTPYTGIFLNVGNMSKVFKYGWLYDRDPNNQENLALLKQYTLANSDEQAVVLWQYLKHFVYEFVSKNSQNGSRKLSGLAQAFNKYLYIAFNKYKDWLPKQYISLLAAEAIGDCQIFVTNAIENLSLEKIQQICQNVDKNNYRQYYRLVEPCNDQLTTSSLLSSFNLTPLQKQQYCDQSQPSFRTVLDSVHQRMHSWFNCTANKLTPRCSSHQLTIKQFFNSQLTLRPIPNSIKNYTSSTSGHDWNPDLGQWEYRHFLKQVYDDPYHDTHQLSYAQMTDLLSFDKLFSNPMTLKIYLQKNQTAFQQKYHFNNQTLLQQWVRFFTIQVAFGGLIQKRTVRELLFGYQDPLINQMKHQDLMRGGDPSRDPMLSINQPNQTLQQAQKHLSSMLTGYDDPYQTRNFLTKDDQPVIYYELDTFDGYQVNTQIRSPFRDFVPLKGTDGIQNKPLASDSQYLYVYVDAMKRISEMELKEQLQHYGFNARRYTLTQRALASSKVYPSNDLYYQSIQGFINATFKGAPIFICASHFRKTDADDNWPAKVQLFDQSGKNQQFSNPYDDTILVIQPKSGATFQATTYLQTNIYFQKDLLFNGPAMLPIFTVYRSGNMTEAAAEELLGALKIGLKAPLIVSLVCLGGIIVSIVSMYVCFRKFKKIQKDGKVLPSLIESLKNEDDSDDEKEQNPQMKDKTVQYQQQQIKQAQSNKQASKGAQMPSTSDQVKMINETIHVGAQQLNQPSIELD